MAAALGNVSSGSATSTSVTVNHTVAAGSDTELLVGPAVAPGPTISDVTWNGVSINALRDDENTSDGRSAIWYEDDPSGTHDVVVTISASNRVIVGVADFNGAGTPSPDDAVGSTGDAQTSASDTALNVGADDMVFDVLRTNIASGATPGANQTERWDIAVGSANAGAGSTQDGADGGVMSWTFDSANYAHTACRIPAASSAQTIAAGQVTEADTAQAVTPAPGPVTQTASQVTEADLAQAVTPVSGGVQNVPVGRVTEGDLAQTVTPAASIAAAVGRPSESDLAQPVTPQAGPVSQNVGQIPEANTARGITPGVSLGLGLGMVSEIEVALPITPVAGSATIMVEMAFETNQAGAVVPLAVGLPGGLVTGVRKAGALGGRRKAGVAGGRRKAGAIAGFR